MGIVVRIRCVAVFRNNQDVSERPVVHTRTGRTTRSLPRAAERSVDAPQVEVTTGWIRRVEHHKRMSCRVVCSQLHSPVSVLIADEVSGRERPPISGGCEVDDA